MDSPLARTWREFRENRIAVAALGVVVLIALLALLAPLIAPQDPYNLASLVLMDARRPPGYVGSGGYVHWLGTDAQGRDLLSAILYGLRISIQIGVLAGAVALAFGATLGTSAIAPAATPIWIEMRSPYRMAENRSRPCASVPSQCTVPPEPT